jgi:hypothetical protein
MSGVWLGSGLGELGAVCKKTRQESKDDIYLSIYVPPSPAFQIRGNQRRPLA